MRISDWSSDVCSSDLGSLLCAGPDEISFLSNPKLQAQLPQTGAAAVILTESAFPELKAGSYSLQPVLCSKPYLMYALLAQWFARHKLARLETGVRPSAVISPTAHITARVRHRPDRIHLQSTHYRPAQRQEPPD